MNPPDELTVSGAALPTEPAPDSFPYPTIRTFQREFVEWCNEPQSEPIAILEAPTGSGKTASFCDLITQTARPTLIIYPTNALLAQQKTVLDEMENVNPVIIDGGTLSGSGIERTNELSQYASPPYRHNVILTNPDILQSILQGQYTDPYEKLITSFFDNVSGVIYDEFHFYDAFEISGILLQLKAFCDRTEFTDKAPNLVLSSATPNEQYLSFIEDELGISTRRISTPINPVGRGDQFRHETTVKRFTKSLYSYKTQVSNALENHVNAAETVSEPSVTVIFNSAKESNLFDEFVAKNHPRVHNHMKTDNGYNTRAETQDDTTEFFILNTTSKGEVGLDFDINALYMDAPATAPAFVQRIGRAGRKTEATVHVYNLNDIGWTNGPAPYTEFIENIYQSLQNPFHSTHRIRNLLGMRAATSVYKRTNADRHMTDEVYSDFASTTTFPKWKQFLDNTATESNNAFQKPDKHTRRLLQLIEDCTDTLCSLRGSGESATIRYPTGTTSQITEYSLITALAHYKLDADADGTSPYVLTTARDNPDEIDIVMRNFGTSYSESYYDYRYTGFDMEILADSIRKSNIDTVTTLNTDHLLEFIQHMDSHAKSPAKIVTPPDEPRLQLEQ